MEHKDEELQIVVDLLNQYLDVARNREMQGKWLLNRRIIQDAEYILIRLLKQLSRPVSNIHE